jgi:hypothetical protein
VFLLAAVLNIPNVLAVPAGGAAIARFFLLTDGTLGCTAPPAVQGSGHRACMYYYTWLKVPMWIEVLAGPFEPVATTAWIVAWSIFAYVLWRALDTQARANRQPVTD